MEQARQAVIAQHQPVRSDAARAKGATGQALRRRGVKPAGVIVAANLATLSRDPDFSNCPPTLPARGGAQQAIPLYDDHVSTAIVAVRDPNFHMPGMRVRVGTESVADVHSSA